MTAAIFPSHAAVLYWLGTGGNSYWNNAFNWTPTQTPTNGDTLFFPFGGPEVNTNNIVGLTLNQICFAGPGGGNDIRGNAFTLTNGIEATNTAGGNTIENNITLAGADQVIDVTASLESIGVWSGSVGVIKTGPGTLIYFGDLNSYTGITTVNAGTLQLDCFELNESFAGPLVINAGTVQDLADEEIPGNEPITINGGSLDLNNLDDQVGAALTLNGNGSAINGNPFFLNSTATITCSPGFLQSCTISGSLALGSIGCTFNVSGGLLHGSLLVPANVSGSGVISKIGAGFLSLSGSNSFSGQLNIATGTVGASSPFALGGTNGVTTVSNTASLDILSSITNESLTVASTGLGIQSGSGVNTWVGPVNLAAATTIEIDGTSLDLQSAITGTGGFTKTGVGTLRLTGNNLNTYAGDTTVNSGVLELNGLNVIRNGLLTIGDGIGGPNADVVRYVANLGIFGGGGVGANTVLIKSSGLLDLNGFSDDVGPIYLDAGNITTGTGVLTLFQPLATIQSTNGNSTMTGNLALRSVSTIAVSNTLILGAAISGPAADTLIKTGPGTLFLDDASTYDGQTVVQQGLLWAFNNLALGSTTNGTVVSNGASLVLDGNIAITNESLTLNGAGYPGLASLQTELLETNIWAGPITMTTNSTFGEFSGGTLRIIGTVSGPGGLDEIAGGVLTLEGSTANTYSGGTTIDNGTLLLQKTSFVNAVPGNVVVNNTGTLLLGNVEQIADSADVLVNSGGVFNFATFDESIDTLHGTGSVIFGSDAYLTIGVNNGSSTFDGVMSGSGFTNGYTVGKDGSGTFTLTGNNTYLFGSDVFGGKLIINGSQPQSPIRIMATGTTLGGSGVIGDIVSAGGTIAPGAAAGGPATLTTSNVVFASSGNFTVELKGPNPGADYDQLNVRGTNNLGNATLTVIPAFAAPVSVGQQFTIISNDGGEPIVGTFNGLANGSIFNAGGYFFRINYNGGTGNDVVLTLVGVPGNTVTLSSVDQGWYDNTGFHDPANNNYFCGENPLNMNIYRNFFVFNAPVSSNSIIDAELIINCSLTSSPHGKETYLLRNVSTPIATLVAGGSGLAAIYNDLADGPVYGVRTVFTNEFFQSAIIPLNVQFINDITTAGGGQIALGGSIASLDPINSQNQYLFSASSANAQLRLTYGTSTTLNAADTGWYDNTGSHSAANRNYFAGAFGTNFYHDFFVYNLPVISGPLVHAQLLVNCYTNLSPFGVNTFELHAVNTPIATLSNGASGAISTYDDLADGTLYGGRDVYVSETGLRAAIPLNTQFVLDAHAHSAGPIALGGIISSLTPSSTNESMFSFSPAGGNPTDAQLWLGFLNAPAVTPVFINTSNLGGGQFQLTLSGTSGTTNEIQGSFDLQNWDYIGDMPMPNSNSSILYTNNTIVPYRFFRAKLMP